MLSANAKYLERMEPAEFGGLVASGYHVYEGALCAWDANGAVVPIQAPTAVAFAGLASGERDNTAGTEQRPVSLRKGTWGLPVAAATPANIGATVYAADDATIALSSLAASVSAKSGNTGNGTFAGAVGVNAGAQVGAYTVTFSAPTAFMVVDANGDSLWSGTTGTSYSEQALGFEINVGTTPFVAGDAFTITVSQASGRPIGTLAGIDNGQTYVKLS